MGRLALANSDVACCISCHISRPGMGGTLPLDSSAGSIQCWWRGWPQICREHIEGFHKLWCVSAVRGASCLCAWLTLWPGGMAFHCHTACCDSSFCCMMYCLFDLRNICGHREPHASCACGVGARGVCQAAEMLCWRLYARLVLACCWHMIHTFLPLRPVAPRKCKGLATTAGQGV